jgi:DNA polymerase III subunit beta
MKIVCKKDDLFYNIQRIEGAVSVKTTLPVLNNVLIECVNDKLNITATDLELTIKCQMSDVNIIEAGAITIPAKKFIDIVRELPPSDVNIKVDDKNVVMLTCNKIAYKIMGMPRSEFPPVLEQKKEALNIKLKQGVLRNLIRKTIFSVSTDETRKILTGVYLIVEGSEIKFVGTDGHRLAFIKEKSAKADKSLKIIVPTKVLNEVLKIQDDEREVEIGILENQITFKIGGVVITSRLIEGQYPSYEQIVNKIFDKKIRIGTEEFLKAVKRVSLLAVDKSSAVKLKASDNKLLISATAADIGEAEEEIPAAYKGEEITIAFNSKYIQDVLKATEDSEVDMQLRDSSSAGLIKPANAENYLYIIMPVRI